MFFASLRELSALLVRIPSRSFYYLSCVLQPVDGGIHLPATSQYGICVSAGHQLCSSDIRNFKFEMQNRFKG